MKSKWLGAAFLVATVGGCDTTNTYVQALPDLAGSPPVGCTPGAKECVSATLARVCPADGAAWLPVQCGFGETCDQGDCTVDVNSVPCTSADNFCTSDTTSLICNDNGQGFHMKMCPANTQCVNGGDCAGSCLVGSTLCLDPFTSLNCADGLTLAPSPCPSGQACSDNVGGCAPAPCAPNNCTAECGNKASDPANTDSSFFSFCQDTPLGWKWVSVSCTAPKTCSPNAACGAQSLGDSCTSECVPNEIRCSDDGSGTQTCGVDGKFGPVVLCDAAHGKTCVSDANGIPIGCGDGACDNGAAGVCVLDGGVSKLRECEDGNLAPANRLTACAQGVCIDGACTPVCQTGDSHCVFFDSSLQSCDAATGNWSPTTTPCVSNSIPDSACFEFTLLGRPRAVCGVCQPGTTKCSGPNASPSPGPTAFALNCGLNGQWSPNVDCVASHCEDGLGCVANCIPGKQVCDPLFDTPSGSPEPVAFGMEEFHNCTADGQMDLTPSPCPQGQSCRQDINGNSYGCVLCVGTTNEGGGIDTQCVTGPVGIQTCKPTNDGYQNRTNCPPGDVCNPMEDPVGSFTPESCDLSVADLQFLCDITGTCDPATANCQNTPFGNFGPPTSCGGQSDCCSFQCTPATSSAPATCSP